LLLSAACASQPPPVEQNEEIYGVEVGPESEQERLAEIVLQDDREALPNELASVREIMKEAESVRGLRFLREFELRVQTKRAISEFVRQEVDARRLKRARDAYVALGLLEPDTTTDAIMEEISKSELQGYYDPTYQRLVLRDDVAIALSAPTGRLNMVLMRSVVLHELVHVLQDQHFGLESQLFSRRSTDGHHAFMALMEGDATLAMMRYQVARMGLDFQALLADQPFFDRIFSGLPPIHGVSALDTPVSQRPEVFRYQAGALLAGGLMRDGGWGALNRAYRKPPPTTRQVMDYTFYLQGLPRPKVNRIPTKVLRSTGHELRHEDSMGRIELGSYMSAGGPGGDMLASGWAADRLLVFEHGGRLGSIWVVMMNEPKEASVVVQRAEGGVGERTRAQEGTFETLQVADTVVLMRNVAPKALPRVKQAMHDWLMSGKAIEGTR
jgi:hypothetical protein